MTEDTAELHGQIDQLNDEIASLRARLADARSGVPRADVMLVGTWPDSADADAAGRVSDPDDLPGIRRALLRIIDDRLARATGEEGS